MNLLIIAPSYTSFIKDPTEKLAAKFDKISVLIRYKPLAEIYHILPISSLKTHTKKYAIPDQNIPSNVTLIPTPLWYLPSWYKKVGMMHYKAVKRVIKSKQIQFDCIYAHFAWTAGFVAVKLKFDYDVPAIITAHGYDVYDLPFRDNEWKEIITETLNSVDHVTTVSKSNADFIDKLQIRTPVEVIHNGYNAGLFRRQNRDMMREDLGITREKTVLLSVGNLLKVKGHRLLIHAFSQVKIKEELVLYIVGDGPESYSLKRFARSLGLNNVFFVGAKHHQEIPKWMNSADFFILPSQSESFGVVQVEAMACGLPVVSTDTGGSREVLNGDVGVIVENYNPKALADGIERALEIQWDRNLISDYAGQFSWERNAGKIYDLLYRLVNSKRPPVERNLC